MGVFLLMSNKIVTIGNIVTEKPPQLNEAALYFKIKVSLSSLNFKWFYKLRFKYKINPILKDTLINKIPSLVKVEVTSAK